MKVTLNDNVIELNDNATLSDALEKGNVNPVGIAVAINEAVVPKAEYSSRTLSDGDTILIIKAFYGG